MAFNDTGAAYNPIAIVTWPLRLGKIRHSPAGASKTSEVGIGEAGGGEVCSWWVHRLNNLTIYLYFLSRFTF
jgi:hypothetical protein